MEWSEFFRGKSILITGGSGSLGRELVRYLLSIDGVEKIAIYSRDEWKQWEMRRNPDFASPKMRYFIGDVRDETRLKRSLNGIHLLFHLAALKQVPTAEYNPHEFIKTNVLGAMAVVEAALDCAVERCLAISTDKAVHPINLYGATKHCSDKLFQAANSYSGKEGKPSFSIVRYGNVVGSRGSIVSLWSELRDQKAAYFPITDKRMTRFWITPKQAALFVLRSMTLMRGGETFVPKIPAMELTKVAAAIDPQMALQETGIREGEKLHELLIGSEDSYRVREMEDFYLILPQLDRFSSIAAWQKHPEGMGQRVKEDFSYSSLNTTWQLSVEEFRRLLMELHFHR